MQEIFIVVSQSDMTTLPSQKAENGLLNKRTLVLKKFGGKYADSFVCSLLGDEAQKSFTPQSVVAASLRFTAHQYDDKWFQDIVADEVAVLDCVKCNA